MFIKKHERQRLAAQALADDESDDEGATFGELDAGGAVEIMDTLDAQARALLVIGVARRVSSSRVVCRLRASSPRGG